MGEARAEEPGEERVGRGARGAHHEHLGFDDDGPRLACIVAAPAGARVADLGEEAPDQGHRGVHLADSGGPAGEGSLQPFVDVLSLERPVVRLAGRRSVKARTDQDESGRGALEAEAEGRLAAPQKGAVPLHQPKVLVNVDSGKPDHRRQLARQRLPLWRKLLARLRPIVIELEQPRLAKALGQVGVVLRGQRQSLGEDGRPARPASSEWVVEVVPPLLLCLPTDAGIVVSVQIILTALLWIGECFICSCHALEPSLRVRAFVLVWMVVSSQLAVRRLDLRL
mmetsp:Transcript_22725/g.73619  ORF Transcript_22725/g.73619 Transcript_22725/m.73619 type:complete len:282 (-) Transcript_22725:125-970(-)